MHLPGDPSIWLKDLLLNAGLSFEAAAFFSTISLEIIVLLLYRHMVYKQQTGDDLLTLSKTK